jgi:hypothetical protein
LAGRVLSAGLGCLGGVLGSIMRCV